MALKWEKTGGPRSLDVLKSSDGRFVIWTMDDGKNFSLDDKKYNRTYGAMSKTAKGCKQRAEMILAEEAPRTKSLFKVGDEVMVRAGVPAPRDFRGVVGKIVRVSDSGYFVVTGPSSAEVHFSEAELKPASRRSTKSLRAKYKAVSDTSEFRPIPNFRWNGQTWAHNGKIGTEIKTGKPTAQYNSVEKRGSRCWRNIDGVITSDD